MDRSYTLYLHQCVNLRRHIDNCPFIIIKPSNLKKGLKTGNFLIVFDAQLVRVNRKYIHKIVLSHKVIVNLI